MNPLITDQLLTRISSLAAKESMPLFVIMGPTASGKSSLAMSLASELPIEIISADSMQIYKGMNIGVAKPTIEERRRIPHHLVDILDISQPLDVFTYVELAEKAICVIRKNGNIPLLVGGSGMYIRALLYGLDPLPADPALRKELDKKFDSEEGFIKLKNIMCKEDPEDFKRWSRHRRKLIRALEVFRLTGESITALQKKWNSGVRFPVEAWKLIPEREQLRGQIAARTDMMLNAGWIDETEHLIKQGLLDSPTARQAIGYSIIADFLDGKIDYDTMRDKIVTATCQFARRQVSWFRNKHPEAILIGQI